MKTEILVEMATLKIYKIRPIENKNIEDDYFNRLQGEIEKLKKNNSSFSCEEYNANSNDYEKLIVFKK